MKRSLLLPLLLFAVVAAAQEPQQTKPAPVLTSRPVVPTLQAHARAVRINVVVTDNHGHAVHGLKPEDFAVLEDDQPQTIQAFEEIRPTPIDLTQAPPKLPPNTFTNGNKVKAEGAMTVLLIDGLDTRLEYQAYAHSELIKYLDHAHLDGPVAIFALDTQLRLIQGFTTDVDTLRRAVQQRDKLIQTVYPNIGGYVVQRFKTEILMRAMQDLGRYLQGFPGRKNLMWFTGSVPNYSYDDGTYLGGALRDSESLTANYARATEILQLGQVSIYPVDAEGLRTNPAFSASQRGTPGIGQIASFGIAQGQKHEDLEEVAAATGGRAFYNTNGIHQAIAEVVETGANYYTLLYTPTNRFWDGKYRKLKLQLDQPGNRLEYRRGYYALTDVSPAPGSGGPAQSLPANSPRRQLTSHAPDPFAKAMQLGAIDPGTIVFQAHVDAPSATAQTPKGAALPPENFLEPKYRDKPYRTLRVTYSVAGKQFQIAPLPSGTLQGSAEFVAVVIDEKGALVNSIYGTVEMNLKPETYARLLTSGINFPLTIAVPVKGNYFLRAGVRDIPSGRSGALELSTGDLQLAP